MQQFTVPQFIDVESKIIGPITTRQFLIFLGAAVLIFVFYKVFDFALFLTSAILIVMIAGTFAFLKVNGRPFHYFLLNLIQTTKKPGLRVWNHRVADFMEKEKQQIAFEKVDVNKDISKSKVAELSLIVDTKGRYRGEDGDKNEIKTQS